MNISQKGIELIKHFESCRLAAYLCPAGVPTIGWGNTTYENGVKVQLQDAISQGRADDLLMNAISLREFYINKHLPGLVNQDKFDALCSFVYNIGIGNFLKSSLFKKVQWDTNDKKVHHCFMMWVYAKKKKLPGLIRRRKSESRLYRTGELNYFL